MLEHQCFDYDDKKKKAYLVSLWVSFAVVYLEENHCPSSYWHEQYPAERISFFVFLKYWMIQAQEFSDSHNLTNHLGSIADVDVVTRLTMNVLTWVICGGDGLVEDDALQSPVAVLTLKGLALITTLKLSPA